MNRRLWFVLSLIVLLAIAGLVIIFRPKPVTVGIQPGTVNYPMMHAIQGGFFERVGLSPDVTVFGSANDALDALLGGTILLDAVIPIQNLATIQEAQPGALRIVALLISDAEHPLDYLVVPTDSPIQEPQDLQGKTIVVFPGSYSETVTRLALDKLGISDVEFIKRGPADMPQALRSGEADAGIFYDPVATLAEEEGWGRIVEAAFWEKNLLSEIVVGAYALNAEHARANPDLARRAVEAIREAIIDSRSNPQMAKQAASAYLPQFSQVLDSIPNSRVELVDEIDPRLIEATLKLYVENELLETHTDLQPTFWE